jgi:hypothetical protein
VISYFLQLGEVNDAVLTRKSKLDQYQLMLETQMWNTNSENNLTQIKMICYAHIRNVELLPSGALAVTITACGQCDECKSYVLKYRSRRIVQLIYWNKVKTEMGMNESEFAVQASSLSAFVEKSSESQFQMEPSPIMR